MCVCMNKHTHTVTHTHTHTLTQVYIITDIYIITPRPSHTLSQHLLSLQAVPRLLYLSVATKS